MKRSILTLVLPLALLFAALAPSPAAADGSGWPAHAIGYVDCGQSYVRTWHPQQMLSWYATDFRNAEQIHWSPDLYRWNGASWQLYDGTRPWYRAFTSSYGFYQNPFGTWQSEVTNAPTVFVPFYNLPSGYYAIKNFMKWDSVNQTHAEFSSYCWVS